MILFEYIKGLLFLVLFITYLQFIGRRRIQTDFTERIVRGYLIYTFFQATGGIFVQLFNLPYLYFKLYMILLFVLSVLISYHFIAPTFKTFMSKIMLFSSRHIKKYYLLYIISSIFVILGVLNLQYMWGNNNIDDGWYLNAISNIPSLDNLHINYASGLSTYPNYVRIINTFEIEGAFWSDIFNISATIYTRVFLSFANYFLLPCVIYELYKTLLKKWITKHSMKNLQYFLLPVLFFGIYYEIFQNYHLLYMNDSWQFNTAMWYGSSIVRTMGYILLVLPFLKNKSLGGKDVLVFSLISFILISKASQALPVIITIGIIFSIIYVYQKFGDKLVFAFIVMLLILLSLVPEIGESFQDTKGVVYGLLTLNSQTVIIRIAVFVLLMSFVYPNSFIHKWNLMLLAFGFFIFCPQINTYFVNSSMYGFVVGRTITMLIFTLIITDIIYVAMFIYYLLGKWWKVKVFLVLTAFVFVSIPLYSIHKNYGIPYVLNVLNHNKYLFPQFTLDLSNRLANLQKEKNAELNVLTLEWIGLNKTEHSVNGMLLLNAPNIHSIGAIARFDSKNVDTRFDSFNRDIQTMFERYVSGEDRDDKELDKIISTYFINCIVLVDKNLSEDVCDKFGFTVVDIVSDDFDGMTYYVLYKNI